MDKRPGTDLRKVMDVDGDPWLIREVDCRAQPGARGDWCLICENVAIVRRIWIYPDDWMTLGDGELAAVCGI